MQVITGLTYRLSVFLTMDELMILTRINKNSRYMRIGGRLITELYENKKIKIKNVVISVDMLLWIDKNGYKMRRKLMNISPSMDVFEYLINKGIKPQMDTIYCAAENGYLERLKLLMNKNKHNLNLDGNVCSYAALNGHLEIIKWAYERKCRLNKYVCLNAAKNGHIEVLKWACEKGCKIDNEVCINAAKNGHLEILKWAYEKGCKIDIGVYNYAKINGHLKILKWFNENVCKWKML